MGSSPTVIAFFFCLRLFCFEVKHDHEPRYVRTRVRATDPNSSPATAICCNETAPAIRAYFQSPDEFVCLSPIYYSTSSFSLQSCPLTRREPSAGAAVIHPMHARLATSPPL